MINSPVLPMSVDDWKTVDATARAIADATNSISVEQSVLNSIVGEEYLRHTIDLLAEQLALGKWDVFDPIEKFLVMVASPITRKYLIDLCFSSRELGAKAAARMLLSSFSSPDLWEHLPFFAQSDDVETQRCGVAICQNVVLTGVRTRSQVEEMAHLFEQSSDDYVREKASCVLMIAAEIKEN